MIMYAIENLQFSWWWRLRMHRRRHLAWGAFRLHYSPTGFTIAAKWCLRYFVVLRNCKIRIHSKPGMFEAIGSASRWEGNGEVAQKALRWMGAGYQSGRYFAPPIFRELQMCVQNRQDNDLKNQGIHWHSGAGEGSTETGRILLCLKKCFLSGQVAGFDMFAS